MRTFGLIGKNLKHSFSKKFFKDKFINENTTENKYINYELKEIIEFKELIKKKKIYGLNVTMPYKELIIPFLDELSKEAKIIGAVNTIRFHKNKLIGYNTDHIGFTKSIKPLLKNRKKAIILGDGGSAKAIKYSLKKLNIEYKVAKRNTSFNYSDISNEIIEEYPIIINTTPEGCYPCKNDYPKIPYKYLTKKNLLFDLIYNPFETRFLAYGREKNSQTKNGLEMLKIQAEESWRIWNL